MMNVGKVDVAVLQFFVTMPMAVRFSGRVERRVRVLMVLVVNVGVLMFHLFVRVNMLVTFAQVQPHADAHERGGNPETRARMLS